MKEKKVTQEVEEQQTPKTPKTFTLLQSIVFLVLALVITAGAGYAVGNQYFWNDIDMNRVNEQLEHYKQKVNADPANLENRIVLGYTYHLKGENDKAIKELMFVLDQDKNNSDALYNLGLVYLDDERYNEALKSFSKAVEITPRDYKSHLQLGIAYRNLKMYDESLEALNKANSLNPSNADIIYQIGLLAEEEEEYKDAVGIYKDALTLDPLYEPAVVALERLKDHDTNKAGE